MIFSNISQSGFLQFDKRHGIVLSVFLLLYLVWTTTFVGIRSDHMLFIIFVGVMFTLHKQTRIFTYSFIFFILFWIIYDSMRVYPNYMVNEVSIAEPYLLEKFLFGIQDAAGNISTPNEYLKLHSYTILDVISGIFYLTWVPVPLALGIYFFFKDKKMLLHFSAVYLFTNIIGFIVYYVYPAAPPWYYSQYGDTLLMNIPGNAAQLLRFDSWFGYPLFQGIYTKNSNVFAAIPSLHAAYPVVTLYFARKAKLTKASFLILIDVLGIWFAAVYSFHHYIIDIIAGGLCAVTAIFIYEYGFSGTKLSKSIDKYITFIQS